MTETETVSETFDFHSELTQRIVQEDFVVTDVTCSRNPALIFIPWRCLRRWVLNQRMPLLEVQFATCNSCNERVGWMWYTSVSNMCVPPSSPSETCATRNSQSKGMRVSAKKFVCNTVMFVNISHVPSGKCETCNITITLQVNMSPSLI
jgi:hypothetical protein